MRKRRFFYDKERRNFFIKRERRGLEYVQNKERRNNKVTK